jgi:hypothetical protein
MADAAPVQDDKTIEKAVWHYVGVGVLWLALFFTGMAFERLGLTSGMLSGVFPGETGALRTQVTECQSNLSNANQEKDVMMRTKQSLEVEVSKLRKQVTQPASATP